MREVRKNSTVVLCVPVLFPKGTTASAHRRSGSSLGEVALGFTYSWSRNFIESLPESARLQQLVNYM